MIELPIIGSILEASGTIIEKKILRKKNINFKNYTVFEFLAIFIIMLPIIYFFWQVKPEALFPKNILLFAFIITTATIANLLIFYSLKREKVTEFEPLWLMQPLFTIILAFILFGSERNWTTFSLALIASGTLVVSHVKKNHLILDKYIIAALLGSLAFAIELVASKPLLSFYSPFTFYFIRCTFILLTTFAIFRPSFKAINKNSGIMIFAVGIIWVLYRAIIYYGYESIGIVYTTLLFILSPVLMILFAVIFLKEKPSWRQIISTIIILVCVIAAVLLK